MDDRSGGVDAKFILFNNLNLRGYYAKTWSPGLHSDNAAFGGRLAEPADQLAGQVL